MASFNKVTLLGNLTRDPELTYTPSGAAVCKFSLALNRKFAGKDGQQKDEVTFVDVTAWARTAEIVVQYLKKGSSTLVEGRLSQDRWQDKNTGQSRTKLYVTAERVVFVGGGARNGGAPQDQESGGDPMDDVPF